jgi:DNA-binding MarR family transcriptional regulator
VRHDLPVFDLNGFIPYQLAVAATHLSKALAGQYRERVDISIAEWRVLVNVGYSGQSSVRDIERRVSLDKSKVSRAASRLEAAGYLTKAVDEQDRRLIKLDLTDRGAALLSEIVPIARAFQDRVATVLGTDFDTVQKALSALIEMPEP